MSEPAPAEPIRIYTASYCGFCHRAKLLLKERGLRFEEIDVTGDFAKREWLAATTGRYTVPQIFIGEQAIGGYDELFGLDRSGRLAKLVGAATERAVS